jgi:hypothetical protein
MHKEHDQKYFWIPELQIMLEMNFQYNILGLMWWLLQGVLNKFCCVLD